MGDGRTGEDADQQRGNGDAELGAGQVERQVGQEIPRHPGASTTLIGCSINPAAVDSDESELSRNKKRTGEDQEGNSQKTESSRDGSFLASRNGDSGTLPEDVTILSVDDRLARLGPDVGIPLAPRPPAPVAMFESEFKAEACGQPRRRQCLR